MNRNFYIISRLETPNKKGVSIVSSCISPENSEQVLQGQKKPEWIKIKYTTSEVLEAIKKDVKLKGLSTVCQESLCPNISECWNSGTATFLLMGDTCTRGCRFCHVKTSATPAALNPFEHAKLVESIKRMNLSYVVITTVDRDDLPDQGANHLAKCIKYIKEKIPQVRIEILTGDFQGRIDLLKNIVDARPEVISHNIETVQRLTPSVRDRRAKYKQSLQVLKNVLQLANESNIQIYTKSSIMVGLGETDEEVIKAMDDLREAGVSFLTIGQYLRPSAKQLAVREYISPDKFKYYERTGYDKGFLYVASGPFVRSSYKAGELFIKNCLNKKL